MRVAEAIARRVRSFTAAYGQPAHVEPHRDTNYLLQRLAAVGGLTYGLWWLGVHYILPTAYNPLGSRLSVVACFFTVWFLSRVHQSTYQRLGFWVPFCCGIATIHYYYLFFNNRADIDWVVGCYIMITACCAIMLSAAALRWYTVGVVILSLALAFFDDRLRRSIFVPGIATLLLFANITLHMRLRLIDQLAKSAEHLQRLYQITRDNEAARLRLIATQEAVRLREEYIAIIAHELKTPLTAIRLRNQMMARTMKNATSDISQLQLTRFVEATSRQADRLIVLVEDMLDVSRIRAGRLKLRTDVVDLSDLVTSVLESFRDTVDSSICITLRGERQVMICADAFRIEQVVLNLLTNAVKYGREQPIEVTVKSVAETAQLSIKDFGIGIRIEDQSRIFSCFERAISARDISGLGLGLFICREIVEAHQGSISVASQLGVGSTFTVTMPLSAAYDASETVLRPHV